MVLRNFACYTDYSKAVDFEILISQLIDAFKQPLPGHGGLPPRVEPNKTTGFPSPNQHTRSSAILLNLYPHQGEIYFPLILRPRYDGTHGGQVAFPGGQVEPEDETLVRTALRETQEEIGLKAIDIGVIGKLTEVYIPPSNFLVTPVVGYLPYRPEFFPDVREVDKVIEVPLLELVNNLQIEQRTVNVRHKRLKTYGFSVEDNWIWGATALMIYEFLEILKPLQKPTSRI